MFGNCRQGLNQKNNKRTTEEKEKQIITEHHIANHGGQSLNHKAIGKKPRNTGKRQGHGYGDIADREGKKP